MNRRGFFAAIAATAFVAVAERTRLGRTVVDLLPKDEFTLAHLDRLKAYMDRQAIKVPDEILYVMYVSPSQFEQFKLEMAGSGAQVKQLDRVLRL